MYVELTGPGERVVWARIGRVKFSKTGRTAYYDGRELRGEGRAWYREHESGERFWIQHARADGSDRGGIAASTTGVVLLGAIYVVLLVTLGIM